MIAYASRNAEDQRAQPAMQNAVQQADLEAARRSLGQYTASAGRLALVGGARVGISGSWQRQQALESKSESDSTPANH